MKNTWDTTEIRLLAGLSKFLDDALNSVFKDWEPELPPITIAFESLGKAIAQNILSVPESTQEKIFSKIEDLMSSADQASSNAVATGLIEALLVETDKQDELWKKIEPLLGIESKKYVYEWNKFCGIEEEELNPPNSAANSPDE